MVCGQWNYTGKLNGARQLYSSPQAVLRRSSGSPQAVQAVLRRSFGSRPAVVWQSSGGPQAVLRQSSSGFPVVLKVVWQSYSNHQAVHHAVVKNILPILGDCTTLQCNACFSQDFHKTLNHNPAEN